MPRRLMVGNLLILRLQTTQSHPLSTRLYCVELPADMADQGDGEKRPERRVAGVELRGAVSDDAGDPDEGGVIIGECEYSGRGVFVSPLESGFLT